MQMIPAIYSCDGFHVFLPISPSLREDVCTCVAGQPTCPACDAWAQRHMGRPSRPLGTPPRSFVDGYSYETPRETIQQAIDTAKAARRYALETYGSRSQAYRRADGEVARWTHRLEARERRAGLACQRRRASHCWSVADLEARLVNDIDTLRALGEQGPPSDSASAHLRKKTRKQLQARIRTARKLLAEIKAEEGTDAPDCG